MRQCVDHFQRDYLPGATISSNTVIGAGSVVTRDIPSGVFAAGNPCKVIKQIDKKIIMRQKTSARIVWIDIIRGMLLFLICLSHSGSNLPAIKFLINPTANYWVPLFFLLSGFLFKNSPQDSYKSYILRKVRTLLIPYLCFSFLFVLLDWNSYIHPSSIIENLYKIIIIGNGPFKASPLWFVMVLFISSICTYPIIKNTEKTYRILLIAIIFSSISLFLSIYKIELPLLIHLAPSAITYMLTGYCLKIWLMDFSAKLYSLKYWSILLIIRLLGGVIGMHFVKLGDFHFNQIISWPLFYLSPIMFGVFLILFSSRIEYHINEWPRLIKPFLWISRNGIIVLACHVYPIICSKTILRALNLSNAYIDFFVTFIVVTIGLIIVAHFINKYCPLIIGKNKDNRI